MARPSRRNFITSVEDALRNLPKDDLFYADIVEYDSDTWPSWLYGVGYSNGDIPQIWISHYPKTSPEAESFLKLSKSEGLTPEIIDKMDDATRREYARLIGILTGDEILYDYDQIP